MKRFMTIAAIAVATVLTLSTAAIASGGLDFGIFRDEQLAHKSGGLYGFRQPIAASSTQQITQAEAQADPTKLATLAKGLQARVVTTKGPAVDDQISLWPNSQNPTVSDRVQRDRRTDRARAGPDRARDRARDHDRDRHRECDPTRRTPWGTIVFGEEDGPEGGLYELIDPMHTTGVTLDRTTGTFSGGVGAENLVTRTALGTARSRARDPRRRHHVPRPATTRASARRTAAPATRTSSSFRPTRSTARRRSRTCRSRRTPRARSSGFGSASARTTGRVVSSASRSGSRCPTRPTRTSRAEGSRPGSPATTGPRTPTSTRSRRPRATSGCAATTPATRTTTSTARRSASPTGRSRRREANTATPEVQPFVFGGTSQGINMPDNIAFQPRHGQPDLHEDAETDVRRPAQQRPVGLPARRGRPGPAVRRLRPRRDAERPHRGMDRWHLRRHRPALLREHPAQHQRQGDHPRHHRLEVAQLDAARRCRSGADPHLRPRVSGGVSNASRWGTLHHMNAALAIVIAIVVILAIVVFVLAARRRKVARTAARRREASETRDLAKVSQLEADRRVAEAEERAARAKRESLAAEQQKLAAATHRSERRRPAGPRRRHRPRRLIRSVAAIARG